MAATHPQADRARSEFLYLLLCGDLLYIILHLLHYTTDMAPSRFFALQLDQGYAEYYQYIKELWLALLCFLLLHRRRQLVYAVAGLLGLYLLLDDALQLHEQLGMKVVFHLQLQPFLMLRGQDWGELAVMTVFVGLFLLALFYARSIGDAPSRRFLRSLAPWLALLLFFGIIMDMVDVLVPGYLSYLLEDGGEMAAMSLLLWQVVKEIHIEPANSVS